MEKKTYYVSVQSDTVMEKQGDAAFEFEIEATPEELDVLAEMFKSKQDSDTASFHRMQIPAVAYHHDNANDAYDRYLQDVYELLYKLGTAETKRHIEQMGVLPSRVQ